MESVGLRKDPSDESLRSTDTRAIEASASPKTVAPGQASAARGGRSSPSGWGEVAGSSTGDPAKRVRLDGCVSTWCMGSAKPTQQAAHALQPGLPWCGVTSRPAAVSSATGWWFADELPAAA